MRVEGVWVGLSFGYLFIYIEYASPRLFPQIVRTRGVWEGKKARKEGGSDEMMTSLNFSLITTVKVLGQVGTEWVYREGFQIRLVRLLEFGLTMGFCHAGVGFSRRLGNLSCWLRSELIRMEKVINIKCSHRECFFTSKLHDRGSPRSHC